MGSSKDAFGGLGSAISPAPWEKYPEKELRKAVYDDPMGRRWQVVPEVMNTGGYDGFELVTPPLRSQQDIEILAGMLDAVARTREFGRGIRSSTHFTFDASHLIGPDGPRTLEVLRKAIANPTDEVRARAAELLAARKDPESVILLGQALTDPSGRVRENAASGLQGQDDAASLEFIASALASADKVVRRDAVMALQGRRDPASLDVVARALEDTDAFVRKYAAMSLGGRVDAKAIGLVEKALGDEFSGVRIRAVVALRGRDDPETPGRIETALADASPDSR